MAASPFKPTRTYPHRSCRLTHNALALLGVVVVTELLQAGIIAIAFIAATSVLVTIGYSALRKKKFIEIVREDAAIAVEDASGRDPRVTIHRGWLRIAVATDVFFLVQSAWVAYILGGAADRSFVAPLSLPGMLAVAGAIAAGIGLMWLDSKAHRCAATPAVDDLTVPTIGDTRAHRTPKPEPTKGN